MVNKYHRFLETKVKKQTNKQNKPVMPSISPLTFRTRLRCDRTWGVSPESTPATHMNLHFSFVFLKPSPCTWSVRYGTASSVLWLDLVSVVSQHSLCEPYVISCQVRHGRLHGLVDLWLCDEFIFIMLPLSVMFCQHTWVCVSRSE